MLMLSWAYKKKNMFVVYLHHNAHRQRPVPNLSPAALNVYKSTDEVLLYCHFFFFSSSYLQLKQRMEKKNQIYKI